MDSFQWHFYVWQPWWKGLTFSSKGRIWNDIISFMGPQKQNNVKSTQKWIGAFFRTCEKKKQSKISCVWDFIDVAQNFYNICILVVNILICVNLANIMSWRIFLIMLKLMLNQTLSAKLRLLLSWDSGWVWLWLFKCSNPWFLSMQLSKFMSLWYRLSYSLDQMVLFWCLHQSHFT